MNCAYDVIALHAFNDNYIWLAKNKTTNKCVVVDPGDADPVIDYITANKLELEAVLITHHHSDHIGGVRELINATNCNIPVYGPSKEAQQVVTHSLAQDSTITLETFGEPFTTLDIPGHTLGHIAYVLGDSLFSGDTLFAAGCGRMFEGTPTMFQRSLSQLAQLPPATRVYCAHEYTLSNLAFAQAVLPKCAAIATRVTDAQALRAVNKPTIPSTIALELATNVFLRLDEPAVVASINAQRQQVSRNVIESFAALRSWKDNF